MSRNKRRVCKFCNAIEHGGHYPNCSKYVGVVVAYQTEEIDMCKEAVDHPSHYGGEDMSARCELVRNASNVLVCAICRSVKNYLHGDCCKWHGMVGTELEHLRNEVEEKPEAVNHPSHYGGEDNPYEVIKVLKVWLTPDEMIGALKFQIIKYTPRAGKKDGQSASQDIAKAAWYADYLAKYLKEIGR